MSCEFFFFYIPFFVLFVIHRFFVFCFLFRGVRHFLVRPSVFGGISFILSGMGWDGSVGRWVGFGRDGLGLGLVLFRCGRLNRVWGVFFSFIHLSCVFRCFLR